MYAVIDLGSNSFHLLIAEFTGDRFKVVDRCSEKIQLAEGLCNTGHLSSAALERGLRCLQHFKTILADYTLTELCVVGTQAIREAKNASHFIQAAAEIGFTVEVISGTEEASLIFRGINDPLPTTDATRLIIDIGGASTEIAIGKSGQVLQAYSLDMGCVKWRDKFFSHSIFYEKNGTVAQQAALEILTPIVTDLKQHTWDEIYSSSGSSKMLSHIAAANNWSCGKITPNTIQQVAEQLHDIAQVSDIKIYGLNPDRIDLLAPGLSILSSIMQAFDINEITHSRTALREGILSKISGRRVDYRLTE